MSQQHCASRCATLEQTSVPAGKLAAISPTEELRMGKACLSITIKCNHCLKGV